MANKRTLNRDLLLSGTYKQRIVQAKKGKGSYRRKDKYRGGNDAAFSLPSKIHKSLILHNNTVFANRLLRR